LIIKIYLEKTNVVIQGNVVPKMLGKNIIVYEDQAEYRVLNIQKVDYLHPVITQSHLG
jgi:hypothetical protein